MDKCRSCGRPLEPDERFCSACGATVEADPARCPSCGRELKAWASFCGGCGRAIAATGVTDAAPADRLEPEEPGEVATTEPPGEVATTEPPGEVATTEPPGEVATTEAPGEVAPADEAPGAPPAETPREVEPPDTPVPTEAAAVSIATDTVTPGTIPPVPPAPTEPFRPAAELPRRVHVPADDRRPVSATSPRRIGPALVIGAALATIGSVLPWLSVLDVRVTAWPLSIVGILSGRELDTRPDKIAYVLLLAWLPVVPIVARRRGVVFVLGAAVVLLAGFTLIRSYTIEAGGPGIGLLVSAAGGLLIVAWSLAAPTRGAAEIDRDRPVPLSDMPPTAGPQDELEYVRPIPHTTSRPGSSGEDVAESASSGWTIPDKDKPEEAAAEARRCPSCGTEVTGLYCSSCGTRVG